MTRRTNNPLEPGHPTTRLEALTDGVFAIVMTILVFDLRLPAEATDLRTVLVDVGPSFAAYLFSFMQLGVYWSGHRTQCAFITHEDHRLRWIVLAFLASIALLPFTTQVVARFPFEPRAEALYVANLLIAGGLLTWHWRHATYGRRLVAADLPDAVMRTAFERTLFAPVVFTIALIVSILTGRSILVAAILIPIPYLVPTLLDASLAALRRLVMRR